MKLTFAILLVVMTIGGVQAADAPMKSGNDGFYVQSWGSFIYQVDTIAQICVMRVPPTGPISTISCNDLAKRPEWKPIITWAK